MLDRSPETEKYHENRWNRFWDYLCMQKITHLKVLDVEKENEGMEKISERTIKLYSCFITLLDIKGFKGICCAIESPNP